MNTSPVNIHAYSKDSSGWVHIIYIHHSYISLSCAQTKPELGPLSWAKITCEKPYAWIGSLPIIYVWLLPYAGLAESVYKHEAGMSSKYVH